MARYFPQDWLDELRQNSDIVQVISSYTQLKRRGKNYIGLCPFHKEKTPSFTVSEDKQLYHCFGCGASGTVFNFIMDIENLDFDGAVSYIAEATHTPLPEQLNDKSYILQKSKRDKIAEINKKVALIYHKLLWQEDGKYVLEYFKERGLNDSDIISFGLGASNYNNIVLDTLCKEGYKPDELVDAFVVGEKDGRYYDMFRNRAIFPIVARGGVVIGFGARALGNQKPKYINTQETALFNKRENLYGLNMLTAWKKDMPIYLVEGYMDVIALNKYGVRGALATLGTALTEEQTKIISRISDKVFICYDGDEAGQNAIERAVNMFMNIEKNVAVIHIPGNKDPDEYLKEYGRESFMNIKPISGMMFLIKRLSRNYDMESEPGRAEFGKKAVDFIAKIKSPIDRESLIRQVSAEFGLNSESAREEMNMLLNNSDNAYQKNKFSREIRKFNRRYKEKISYTNTEVSLLAYSAMKKVDLIPEYESFFDNEALKYAYNRVVVQDAPAKIVDDIELKYNKEGRELVANAFSKCDTLVDLDESDIMRGILDSVKKRDIERKEQKIEKLKTSSDVSNIEIIEEIKKLKQEINELWDEIRGK